MAPYIPHEDLNPDGDLFFRYYDTGVEQMPHKLTLARHIPGVPDGYSLVNAISDRLIPLFDWCEEQFGPPYRNPIWRMTREPITFHFERKDDAMLFKLNSQL